jgi:hypothetical protein
VLPGVTVTARQDETGLVSSVTTHASGQFVFSSLRVGYYTVAAELQGFNRMLQRDVHISVQDRREVNFALDVGAVAEEVIVRS